jgi:DNA-binding MarR family transcriptional regulator
MEPGDRPETTPVQAPHLEASPGFLIRRLHSAYAAIWQDRFDGQLTGPQFALLTEAARRPDTDQRTLAAAIALDRSTMADLVKRLEGRGYISRAPSPDDGRRKLVRVTCTGHAVLKNAMVAVSSIRTQLLGGMSPVEQADAMALLGRLAQRWEALSQRP